jgi:hypothetical protein
MSIEIDDTPVEIETKHRISWGLIWLSTVCGM